MAAERFVQTLQEKGYPLRVVRNDGGHNWDNWAPLVPESLRAFAGTREEDEIVGEDEDANDEQPEE
jgi:S-formylglutathione hydrolase FrmB